MVVRGQIGKASEKKLNKVLEKNEGYQVLVNSFKVISGESVELEIDPNIVSVLKTAPITSVDVEQSFSTILYILSDRRQRINLNNLEKHIIVCCYRQKSEESE